MRPSHSFPTDTDPLLAKAHDIVLRGPTVAITRQLTAIEANDLRNAAQRYIDTDGDDDGDLAYLLAEIDAWLNPVNDCLDEDQFWRESSIACLLSRSCAHAG